MPESASPTSDDLGGDPGLGSPPGRVVSLVPSLTETIAASAPGVLVGATDFCTHPPDLDVARVGGPKYPSLDAILAVRPDLVVANAEENRREDVEALRGAGVPVWVTYPRTVPAALDGLGRLVAALGADRPAWLDAAVASWAASAPTPRITALVPVWRRPWVVLGGDTFAADVLRRLGVDICYADATSRYPRPSPDELRALAFDLLVLPDEPYRFTAEDGPEAFPGRPYALVSGRHLTWYGPSLAEARDILSNQLSAA